MENYNKIEDAETGIGEINYDGEGLVPAVIQDFYSRDVLMLAYMDEEAVRKTLQTGYAWFWSRSRQQYWQKGETSGNVQKVKGIYYDCDGDALLLLVEQKGVACHTGNHSCFFRHIGDKATYGKEMGEDEDSCSLEFLLQLARLIRERKAKMPADSYVVHLLNQGEKELARKMGEESLETVLAYIRESPERVIEEGADLIFHLMVAVEARQIPFEDIIKELQKRHGKTK